MLALPSVWLGTLGATAGRPRPAGAGRGRRRRAAGRARRGARRAGRAGARAGGRLPAGGLAAALRPAVEPAAARSRRCTRGAGTGADPRGPSRSRTGAPGAPRRAALSRGEGMAHPGTAPSTPTAPSPGTTAGGSRGRACCARRRYAPTGLAIELGPGFSTKVGHGLREVGFHGELVVASTPTGRPASSPSAGTGSCSPARGSLRWPSRAPTPRPSSCSWATTVLDDMVLRRMLSPVPSDALFAEDAARRALLGGLRAELAPDPRRRPGDRRRRRFERRCTSWWPRVRTTGARRLLAQRVPELAPPRLRARRDPRAPHAGAAAARPGAVGPTQGRPTVVLPSVEPEMRWLVSVAGEPAAGTPIGLDRSAGPRREPRMAAGEAQVLRGHAVR